MAINWTQVNVPTILAVAAAAAGLFNFINGFDKRLSESESYRVMRSAQTDQKFADITTALNNVRAENGALRIGMENIPYRMGNVEKGLEEQGKRTDRLSELILSNMDGFRKDIGSLGTKIEVLTSRIDNSYPQRRTELMLSPIPGRD